MFATLGGLGGLLVGRWLLTSMLTITPEIPRLDTVTMDLRVVSVMAVVTAVAGIIFGVGPALHAASTPPEGALREGGQATTGSGRRITLQSGLVTTEIALSTVLTVAAVLLFATFRTAIMHDRGFEFDNLLAVQVDPLHPPTSGDEAREYFRSIIQGVTAIPGVRDAALSSHEIMEQKPLARPASDAPHDARHRRGRDAGVLRQSRGDDQRRSQTKARGSGRRGETQDGRKGGGRPRRPTGGEGLGNGSRAGNDRRALLPP